MNIFIVYMPSYIDRANKPRRFRFETTEELLAFEPMKLHSERLGFCGFALSYNNIMALYDDGFKWYVVGYVENSGPIDLPKWKGWKYRAQVDDGEIEVFSGPEILSSCGDTLILSDGRKAKII